MKILAAFSVASALTALASPCFAQRAAEPAAPVAHAAPPAAPQPDAEPAYTVSTVNGRRVYVLARGDIIGERQRPYAFTVSGRAALGYTALETSPSFVPAVTGAVRRDPF
jgi:hypothetical protein